MTIIRATVTLAMKSGVPLDNVVNVWHFQDPTGILTVENATAVGLFVPAFYANPGLAIYWSPAVTRSELVHKVSVAEVNPLSPGADDDAIDRPIWEQMFSITTVGAIATALPSEVACCLSFAGETDGIPEKQGMTRPASRRRGRLYCGPFNTAAGSTDSGTGRNYPDLSMRQAIIDAYQPIVASLKSNTPAIHHTIYSPTNGNAFPVVRCHVDDAWDTIRSRGQAATSRVGSFVP